MGQWAAAEGEEGCPTHDLTFEVATGAFFWDEPRAERIGIALAFEAGGRTPKAFNGSLRSGIPPDSEPCASCEAAGSRPDVLSFSVGWIRSPCDPTLRYGEAGAGLPGELMRALCVRDGWESVRWLSKVTAPDELSLAMRMLLPAGP